MKKLIAYFLGESIDTSRKQFADYKMDLVVKQGSKQFKKLVDKGLQVPVVLL